LRPGGPRKQLRPAGRSRKQLRPGGPRRSCGQADERPPASKYTDVCKQCWPADRRPLPTAGSDAEFEGSTSSSEDCAVSINQGVGVEDIAEQDVLLDLADQNIF